MLELPDGKRREIYLGQLGAEIDKVRLAELVRDARDPTSPMVRTFRASGTHAPLPLPVPVTLNRDQALPALAALKDELDRAAVDARLDLDARSVVPEANGRLLDVDGSLLAIERALEAGATSARVVYNERQPTRTAKVLAGVRFDAVLGWFVTRYARSEKYAARTFNLREEGEQASIGHVLPAGETPSIPNDLVGPWTKRTAKARSPRHRRG